MGKEHTHTFWLITLNSLNFQSEKSFGKLRLAFQTYHQILCILKYVRDVGDRSSTPRGCNAIYYVGDRNNLQYTQCLGYGWKALRAFQNFFPIKY